MLLRCGLEFDRKYNILHDLRTSTPFEEKSSDYFKDLHKLKPLTNFDVNLTSLPGRIMDQTFNPSDTKGFGTTSDTKGGWVTTPPLLSHNSLDLGT